MRAWIEMPPDAGWGRVRVAEGALHALDYTTEEMRGAGPVLLRLSGSRLEVSELWRTPGQG